MSEYADYRFECANEGNGLIFRRPHDVAVWSFRTQEGAGHFPYGILKLPPFVFCDDSERALLRFTRERRLPLGQFGVFDKDARAGTVASRSPLGTRYAIDFPGMPRWTFRMPLFSVAFRGTSESGAEALVRMATHNIWLVRVDAGADDLRLIAALAFIHRERLRRG